MLPSLGTKSCSGSRFEGRFRTMETQLDGDLHRDLDELVEVWKRVKEEG